MAISNTFKDKSPFISFGNTKPLAVFNPTKYKLPFIFSGNTKSLAISNTFKDKLPFISFGNTKPSAVFNPFKPKSPFIFSGNIKFSDCSNQFKYKLSMYSFVSLFISSFLKATSFSSTLYIVAPSFLIFLLLLISSILGSFCHPKPSIFSSISYKNINSSFVNSSFLFTLLSIMVNIFISFSFFRYLSLSGNSFNFSSNIGIISGSIFWLSAIPLISLILFFPFILIAILGTLASPFSSNE